MTATLELDGPADAPPIVFVHGTRLSRTMWRPVMRRLASSYRVIAVDLPGHGSRSDVPFAMDAAVASVVSAVDEQGGGRAALVGLSLGGYVAMDVAARYPERVRALVLSGASQDPVGFWAIGFRALGFILGRSPLGPLDFVNHWFFQLRYPSDVARAVQDGGFWSRAGAVAVNSLTGRRFLPLVAAYGGPVLLLNGELDIVFRAGERRFLAAARDGRRVVVPWATHLVNLDRPDAFAAAVRTFVRGLPPEGTTGSR